MKKAWRNPVKDQPARPETLEIKGDFQKFTADMKRLLRSSKTEKQQPTSASPVPVSRS